MHPQIQMMITGFKTGVDNAIATANDPVQVEGLKKVYEEMAALGEACGDDFMSFTTKATEADLFNRLTQEMEKANSVIIEQQANPETRKEVGKDQIWDMYKNLYEDVKQRQFMFETVKAYEDFLALADDYESLTAWQAAAYKQGIQHRLDMASSYDICKLRYDKTPPNKIYMKKETKAEMEAVKKARNSNEEMYLSGIAARSTVHEEYSDLFIIDQISEIVGDILGYHNLKMIAQSGLYLVRPDYLLYVKLLRDDIKKRYTYLSEKFGVDWDIIESTPRYVKKILHYHSELNGFVWFSSDPANLDWYKEILFNEIMTNKNMKELLLTRRETRYSPLPQSDHTDAYNLHDIMFQKVKEVGEDFYWAEYDINTLRKGMELYYDILHKEQEKGKRESNRQRREVLAETAKDEIAARVKTGIKQLF